MIIHAPHTSTKINGLIEFKDGKEKENLDFLTDTDIDYIFSHEYHQIITFPFSRFVCDVERLPYDPMDDIGQGIVYRRDIFGNKIKRNISDSKVYELYKTHHKKLSKAISYSLSMFPKVIIIDAHSFSYSNGKDIDVCIGTDSFHTPKELSNIVIDFFTKKGYKIGINDPFEGTMIPQLYKNNSDVYSIMIELNKKIYINNLEETRNMIGKCLTIISDFENKE